MLMGIDLGTSSVKAIVMDENGTVMAQGSQKYAISTPSPGFAEQDPADWWDGCVCAIRQCFTNGLTGRDIKSVSFSGQMHGTVPLDTAHRVIRPAIIHCDSRSSAQAAEIEAVLGRDYIVNRMLNPIFPGFQLTSLAWMRENEMDAYDRIEVVLTPKDYVRFCLTGDILTDRSDASATLAYDIHNSGWNTELLHRLSLPVSFFPRCVESIALAGYVTAKAAEETGLTAGTPVMAGGGDQAMQALGNGLTDAGDATVTIGTGGQVFFPTDAPLRNPKLNTHSFCGPVKGYWFTMGAMLTAGACLAWLKDSVLGGRDSFADLDTRVNRSGIGGLVFLPYLNGERTPHLNTKARGLFFGLTLDKTSGELARAVMEGVTFGMNQCLQACMEVGLRPRRLIASGGATRSRQWLQMQADVYGMPLHVNDAKEHAAVGAAITAGVGAGMYADIREACRAVVRIGKETVEPNMQNHALYRDYFELYKALYTANIQNFERLAKLGRNTPAEPQ